jgi:ribosomal protein S18 acetylase RimI-like enzyme
MASQPEPTTPRSPSAESSAEPTESTLEPAPRVVVAVRRAEPADVPALTRMLVRAYMDDPVAMWTAPWEDLRAQTLAGLYSARLRQMLIHRAIWTDPKRSSAAVWLPPHCPKTPLRPNAALLRCLLDPRLLARAPFLALGLRSMSRAHPEGPPHWYLSLLGTDPDARERGLGSAVLQPVLERCDKDGVGAYLESSKPRNLDFYARFGFQVTGELQLPHGGPTMWPMWRAPRLAQASPIP